MTLKEFVECVGEIQIFMFTRILAGENNVEDGGVGMKKVRLYLE
jgi:hypothetical protein